MDKQTPDPAPSLANDPSKNYNKFPYVDQRGRLTRYTINDKLFFGNHFDAFRLQVDSTDYTRDYARLRYIAANFAGLISKVCADMLFSEQVKIKVEDGDQDFIDALIFANKLHTQFYESALGNSRHGDAIFKIRSGELRPGDEKLSVIIEDITPSIYFPHVNSGNVREEPEKKELAWKVTIGATDYVRKEIHEPGLITNELWRLEGEEIKEQANLNLLGDEAPAETEETNITRSLIVHVPNWKDGSSYFGYDDYTDLNSLFYALNNRLTKNDNILDKHSDPILALPEGVLDEQGKVRKESFHMFEIPDSTVGAPLKPEYIVWNASLEASFKEIEKIVEMLYMFSETSPDAFGMGDGKVDSGRALKLRLMRTIAKVARKRIYYDAAIKEVLYTAQLFAKANSLECDGVTISDEAVIPELIWSDGLPVDDKELIDNEVAKLGAGIQSKEDAIAAVDNIDEDAAEIKLAKIKEEDAVAIPTGSPKSAQAVTGKTPMEDEMNDNATDGANGVAAAS